MDCMVCELNLEIGESVFLETKGPGTCAKCGSDTIVYNKTPTFYRGIVTLGNGIVAHVFEHKKKNFETCPGCGQFLNFSFYACDRHGSLNVTAEFAIPVEIEMPKEAEHVVQV